ncbi:MAG: ABC transporter permease, partial [Geminicoccaceae bacterium]
MLIYTVQRVGLAGLIVLVAMIMLFGMIYLVPGDPASIALGPRATPEMKAALNERMGLDKPIPVQLFNFISGVATGDLGVDVWSSRSVVTIVLEALPHTLALTALGLGWSVTLGIVLGCFSATHRSSWIDRTIGIISVSAIAVPSFVVALYSLIVFAVVLK